MELSLQKREITGKKNNKLRREGIIPGGISMADASTLMVQAGEKELIALPRMAATQVFDVTVADKKIKAVLTELIVNPLNNKIESFTLTELTPKSHVTVRVPIEFTGISPAVKNNLGTLIRNIPELRLTVNSENIIEKIVVDISSLTDTGSRILVSQIPDVDKMKLASEKDRTLTVVTVKPLRQASEVSQATAAAAAQAEGAAAAPATGEAAPAVEAKK